MVDIVTLPICFTWEGKDGNPVTQTLFKRGKQPLTVGRELGRGAPAWNQRAVH